MLLAATAATAVAATVLPAFAADGSSAPASHPTTVTSQQQHRWALPTHQLVGGADSFLPYRWRQTAEHARLVRQRQLRQQRRREQQRRHAQAASRAAYRAPITDPQTAAHAMVLQRGWSEAEWSCLDQLWMRESSWNTYASNPSGAYGIPQALPASKMATFGADYRTNPITQIQWGLWYISASYGTPCGALSHENAYGFY
jgi:hypothetical protein